jgi:soluble lytic murein transglycosylase
MSRTPTLITASLLAAGLFVLPAGAANDVDVTSALPATATTTVSQLQAALDAIDGKRLADARAIASSLPTLEHDIVTWMAIRRGIDGLTPQEITDFARRRPDWPSVELMRRRAEQALADMQLPPEQLAAAFAASPPISEAGLMSLTRALIATGRRDEAAALIAKWWKTATLSPDRDAAIIAEFGSVLTPALHKARFTMLMYADRMTQAAALTRLFPDPGYAALAAARTAVLRGAADAGAKLAAVPPSARADPLYGFTLAEWHRRNDRPAEAAQAALAVDAKATAAHADAWWIERRIVSRDLIERGNARLAYRLAASQVGGGTDTLQEASFHAGWYALRFLKDPATALRHFEALEKVSQKPISRARAAYWIARTHEQAGRTDAARRYYRMAADDEFAYYGQLARVKLGLSTLGLPPAPKPSDDDRAAFSRNEMVRILVLLIRANHAGDAAILYPELAKTLPTGGQVALLAGFAEDRGDHRTALQVGKLAADRGLDAERLAFPLEAIPESARHQKAVETAMVYAIARQESAFDPRARSSAGALGLLQLMPTTAALTARGSGLAYSKDRLTADPAYNATLGAAHLRELSDMFGGSYIMTFAAYNAGKGKVREWVQRFGDPRDPRVDPVDWIESIPYGETRNYVQRVLENLQVYRERLDGTKLAIAEDLKRGAAR